MKKKNKKMILFVCMENACRSQMAEGLTRELGGDAVEVHSAGSTPSGKVNARAIAFMKERGINISKHKSKGLTKVPKVDWDALVTMGCGDACPDVKAARRLDWALPNPKSLPDATFRMVRDQIEQGVIALLRQLGVEASQ